MLDPSTRFQAPGLPQIDVYRDHTDQDRFYAVPKSPRVVTSGGFGIKAAPQINLLVYTRKQGSQAVTAGGQFSVSIAWALREEERAALIQALKKRLTTADKSKSAVDPVVVSPDWVDGKAGVWLTKDLHYFGKPAMMGENICSLSASLNADQADTVRQAWARGLKDARLYYRMEVKAAKLHEASAQTERIQKQSDTFAKSQISEFIKAQVRSTDTIRHVIEAEGPMGLSASELKSHIQVINL